MTNPSTCRVAWGATLARFSNFLFFRWGWRPNPKTSFDTWQLTQPQSSSLCCLEASTSFPGLTNITSTILNHTAINIKWNLKSSFLLAIIISFKSIISHKWLITTHDDTQSMHVSLHFCLILARHINWFSICWSGGLFEASHDYTTRLFLKKKKKKKKKKK